MREVPVAVIKRRRIRKFSHDTKHLTTHMTRYVAREQFYYRATQASKNQMLASRRLEEEEINNSLTSHATITIFSSTRGIILVGESSSYVFSKGIR